MKERIRQVIPTETRLRSQAYTAKQIGKSVLGMLNKPSHLEFQNFFPIQRENRDIRCDKCGAVFTENAHICE